MEVHLVEVFLLCSMRDGVLTIELHPIAGTGIPLKPLIGDEEGERHPRGILLSDTASQGGFTYTEVSATAIRMCRLDVIVPWRRIIVVFKELSLSCTEHIKLN
jgi:hypothetical protein